MNFCRVRHPSRPSFSKFLLQPFSVVCGICPKIFWMWRLSENVRRTPEAASATLARNHMPVSSSNDLKAHIPALRYEQGFSVKKICQILNIKKTQAYQSLRLHRSHGLAYDPNARRGVRRCLLTNTDLSFIRM